MVTDCSLVSYSSEKLLFYIEDIKKLHCFQFLYRNAEKERERKQRKERKRETEGRKDERERNERERENKRYKRLIIWVLCHINPFRFFNAKSIFILIISSILNNSV